MTRICHCGNRECPCEQCHGEGPETRDSWDNATSRHIQTEIPCSKCEQDARTTQEELQWEYERIERDI
ncbi:MAG: hypothetical protein Unbinned400contig1002_9 [Prokaryotic dsDNA virus sp.]|nr:MAG: hypothetical protein Unbinned400contig1002_9 [Prokaryotic dsDNA virus sp.]